MQLQHCQLSNTCMYEKGLVIGMIISQGGGGPDEVKLGAIIQTPPIIQTTPISFLQRLVLHIAHVLSQLGMIIQTSPISFLQRLVMHIRTLYKCAISALPFQFHVAVTTILKSFHGLLFQMIQTSSYIWQE